MPESAAAHALLVKVQADIADIDKVVNGLSKISSAAAATTKVSLGLADAFKFAGVELALEKVLEGITEIGRKIVEVTVDFVKESIHAAAEIQTETFPLTQMLKGHEDIAEEVLHNLHGLWQELGVISNESLGTAAKNLLLIQTPAENLIDRLRQLGKIAVGTGNDLTNVVAAWQRFRQASETGTEPAVRGMGGFGAATEALAKIFGKTAGIILDGSAASDAAVKKLVANGKIGIPEMIKALQEATRAGGEFFDVIEKKKDTFDGAIQDFKTAWKGLQVTVGQPIIDRLTPIINNLAEFTRKVTEIAHDQSWQLALQLTWNVVMHKLGDATRTILREAFILAGSEVADALFWTMMEKLAKLMDENMPNFVKNLFAGTGLTAEAFVKGAEILDQLAKGLIQGVSNETRDAQATLQKFFDDIMRPSIDFEEVGRNIGAELDEGIIADLQKKLHPELAEVPEGGKQDVPARNLAEAMHNLAAAMSSVRQEQTLLAANPFILPDEKQTEQIKLYRKELEEIVLKMAELRAVRDSPFMNDAQVASANQKLQEAASRVRTIGLELTKLATPFKTEMAKWAESFGTTGHQVAQSLQQSIGASLQSLNQYLLTGKFNAQSLAQGLGNIALQLVENLAIQQIMALFSRQQSQAAITEGAAIAAANAPGAAAKSIAQYGPIVGAAAAVAAIAAIVAAIALAHEGGPIRRRRRMHSGGLASDEVPIIAQEGEIMIRRSVAQQPGMADYLLGLNSGMYHSGGRLRRMHPGGWIDPDELGEPIFGSPSTTAFGGPSWAEQGLDPGAGARFFSSGNIGSEIRSFFEGGFGTGPQGMSGITRSPTFWTNYPGVGWVPRAIPVAPGGWEPEPGKAHHHTPPKGNVHRGGLINRYHDGGSVSGGGGSGGSRGGSGIHIYAFTDLKQLTKHMGSKAGQKIIFDTVRGRRIDLGIS